MPRLRSTLVPLDGSPFAERAVASAAELATAAEASLLLVRTAESSRHPHPGQQNAREHQAQVYLGQMRRRLHGTGVAAGVAVPPGHTPDALLAEVDRQKPDLIVVTSHGHSGFRRMVDLRIPVIAQVHGYCLAGGSELALLCDLIVAAQDAQIGHPAVRSMGVPPTNIYPYAFGLRKAKQMVLTGDTIDGARAAELGIVNWSAAADDLDRFTLEIARRIARIPRDMLTLNKRAVNRAYELMGFRAGVEMGIEYDAMAHFTPPAVRFWETAEREGLRAALAERDRPFTAEGGGR